MDIPSSEKEIVCMDNISSLEKSFFLDRKYMCEEKYDTASMIQKYEVESKAATALDIPGKYISPELIHCVVRSLLFCPL